MGRAKQGCDDGVMVVMQGGRPKGGFRMILCEHIICGQPTSNAWELQKEREGMDSSTQIQYAERMNELRTEVGSEVGDEVNAVARRLVGRTKKSTMQNAGYAKWAAAIVGGVGIASAVSAWIAFASHADDRKAPITPNDVDVARNADSSISAIVDADPLDLSEPNGESIDTFLRQINVLMDDPIDPRAPTTENSATDLPASEKIIAAQVEVDLTEIAVKLPVGQVSPAAADTSAIKQADVRTDSSDAGQSSN